MEWEVSLLKLTPSNTVFKVDFNNILYGLNYIKKERKTKII